MRQTLTILALTVTPAMASPQLAGTYEGIIWSAGSDEPGTTVLQLEKGGTVTGRYQYVDGSTPAEGKITDCRYKAPVLRCQWTDAYGSGAWVVRFNSSMTAFEGSWYDYSLPKPHDKPEGGYKWTGRKKGG